VWPNPAKLSPIAIYAVLSIAAILTVCVRLQIAFTERAELEIDNTVLRTMLHSLNVKANYDGLTGLPNVRLLPDRFREALVRAQRGKTNLALYNVKLEDFGESSVRKDSLGYLP
jgi:GGDEF domain-containing protein